MNRKDYKELQRAYPRFLYESFGFGVEDGEAVCRFRYRIEGAGEPDVVFNHRISYGFQGEGEELERRLSGMEGLVFHIGLMESINYWKTTCSREFRVQCGHLSPEQALWWKKLFYHGLGEFIYLNGLHKEAGVDQENFVEFVSDREADVREVPVLALSGNLIPVGGGKDSVVTLELLKDRKEENLCFVMNPPQAAFDCIRVAGYEGWLLARRTFDRKMLDMNSQGFLNGHVPYSAILAWASVLGAVLAGKRHITLSNEKSANEPSVPGTDFNHQYSKSFDFEWDFNRYLHRHVLEGVEYFSLLRRMYELEIARRFAAHTAYHGVFRSCNRGKGSNSWCGHCPKCLFVFIILGPWMSLEELHGIFGKDLLADESLSKELLELLGLGETKPFECVGTVAEVRLAMKRLYLRHYRDGERKGLPALMALFLERMELDAIGELPGEAAGEDLIPPYFEELLKKEL
ncbi:hypothetical protein [Anaerotalea alkaliphila]|uniref:UDP-N-acetyl-alpha-D-muramoyl-L-alanyl-L-glutamate epimerase n=1 Tax=Anaerotalea alkaliphila TaxID=2662126 RepID=A0A7X5KMP4_9FIRM|nr:hypothetical protein [Anaerotalea alkaliphila]NDL68191.1 hypothetical protein [Anaerotalea alkaliphila]